MSGAKPASGGAGRLNVGDVVAQHYRITGVVGRGGMGAVYRATQLETGIEVALKVLLTNYASSEVDAKRFRREAALVQKLIHPNIVRQLDFGQTERGVPYIAFELLHGKPLGSRLREAGHLALPELLQIATDVLRALSAAHQQGVIHRDIKPQNIFLTSSDNTTKLLDFGIAKTLESEGNQATQLTASGQMIGTPHYMAPEQVRGLDVGPATDLYAVGLIIAEMLCGERVVKGDAIIEVYITHISDEPLALHPKVQASPLADIVAKAISKDPTQRYGRADDMLHALLAVDVASSTDSAALLDSGSPTLAMPAGNDLNSTVLITAHLDNASLQEAEDSLAQTVDDLAATTEELEHLSKPVAVGKTVMLPQEFEPLHEVPAMGGFSGLLETAPLEDGAAAAAPSQLPMSQSAHSAQPMGHGAAPAMPAHSAFFPSTPSVPQPTAASRHSMAAWSVAASPSSLNGPGVGTTPGSLPSHSNRQPSNPLYGQQPLVAEEEQGSVLWLWLAVAVAAAGFGVLAFILIRHFR